MKVKKNIVLLIPSLKRGGAERVVSRLSKLLKDDYNLNVVLFDSNEQDYSCECDVVSLDIPSIDHGLISKFIRSIKRIVKYYIFKKNNEIDLTYSFGNTANIVNVFSFGKDKKVTSLRGYGNIKFANKSLTSSIISLIAQVTNKRSDLIICVSELIKETIINKYNIEKQKVKVIYNGYNVEEIKEKADIELNLQESLWLKNKFVYVSMGSFRSEKGYINLIKAFSKVNEKEKNTGLMIIGKGNKKEEEEIKKLICELNMEENVYLAGFKSNPYNILANCQAYVLSSITEGFPNALVEAMACRLPIIATDCKSGPREILSEEADFNKITQQIDREKYGILVHPILKEKNNENEVQEALRQAMLLILENTDIRNNYILAAEKRAKHFSYELWKKEHIDILNNMLNEVN